MKTVEEIVVEHFEWIYENVLKPLHDENDDLKRKVQKLDAESKRYRDLASKLKSDKERLRDQLEKEREGK